jgi:ATP-binding cassette subfamily B protein
MSTTTSPDTLLAETGDRLHTDISAAALCRFVIRYALRRWRGMAAVMLAMFLKIGFDLLKPWPAKILVDHALRNKPMSPLLARLVNALPGSPTGHSLVGWCVAATVVLFLLAWSLGVFSAMSNVAFGQRLALDMAGDLFSHLQRLSLRFHHRRTVGDLIRRVTTDSASVTTIVKDALLPAVSSIASLLIMFAVLWSLNAPLALASMAVVPMLAAVFRRYAEPMLRASYRQQEVDGRIYNVVEQTLSAMPVVQAFSREDEADRVFRQHAHESVNCALATTTVQLKFKVLTGLCTSIGTATVLWIGANQSLAGDVTVGDLLVFLSYLASVYAPLEALAYTSSTVQNAAGSARRVVEVLQADPEVVDRPHARPLSTVAGHVRIENVTFGYEADRPVLRAVSLEALPGQMIALVGPTGAGKSTLAALVPRFFDPWQGRVTVDGQDLRDVRLANLRASVSIVLQEPLLFPISIAENIAYGRPDATREEIIAAARAANAHEFIVALPDGYDTVVGPRGATLSGGERQRVSIARALLRDTPILILDEPTSAIDAGTEALILDALRKLMLGRTTLVIAHRLSTIREADRIVVLDAGQVVEEGTHEQLLQKQGLYSQMHLPSPPAGRGFDETLGREADSGPGGRNA